MSWSTAWRVPCTVETARVRVDAEFALYSATPESAVVCQFVLLEMVARGVQKHLDRALVDRFGSPED